MEAKTFSSAGVTIKDGVVKVRYTNDMSGLVKMLNKSGHIFNIVNLPSEMNKKDILMYLKSHPDFQDIRHQDAISHTIKYREVSDSKKNGTYLAKKRGRPSKNVIVSSGIERMADFLSKNTISVTPKQILEAAGISV